MASSSAHEPAETRSVARPATQQHEHHLKSNRFHPWLAAKRPEKPNIAATAAQPNTSDSGSKSPDECNSTRIISHSINSIINGR
jgi:hypothetical protein